MQSGVDKQATLRSNVSRVLLALKKSAKGVDPPVLDDFFRKVRGKTLPQDITRSNQDWWGELIGIHRGNWSKNFGNSKRKLTLKEENVKLLHVALRHVGFDTTISNEAAVDSKTIEQLSHLTPDHFREKFKLTAETEPQQRWLLTRNDVIELIEDAFKNSVAVCLHAMTGSGKTIAARQVCGQMKVRAWADNKTVADLIEVGFPSSPDAVQPRSVGRLFGRLFAHSHTPHRLISIHNLDRVVEAAEKKGVEQPEDRRRWEKWYQAACEIKSRTDLAAHFERLPFSSSAEGGKRYLRAIAEWLAEYWTTPKPDDYRLVVLIDNVWNWDWVWHCLEPLLGDKSAIRILFTAQRRPPVRLGIAAIALPVLGRDQVRSIITTRVAEALLSRVASDRRTVLRDEVYTEANQAFDTCQDIISAVVERIASLPIAIVTYAAVWSRENNWSAPYRRNYWKHQLKALDHALQDNVPADFAEQLGSDNPDHRKSLYHALKLPWQLLPSPAQERYLDLVLFGHGPILYDVLGVLWIRSWRADSRLMPSEVSGQLALFEEFSLLQGAEQVLRLHDLHLSLIRSLLRHPINGKEREPRRDLLDAVGSFKPNGEFKVPRLPVEGLGRGKPIERADDGAQMFVGSHVDEAERFLFEHLPEFVEATAGEAGQSILGHDVGFLACSGHRAARQFRQLEARDYFGRALHVLAALTNVSDHAQEEIILRISMARVVLEQSGYLDPSLPDLLLPAITQSVTLKWEEMAVRAYFDLSLHYIVVGKIEESQKTADAAWDIAKNSPSVARRLVALRNRVTPPLLRGEFLRAKLLIDEVLRLAEKLPEDNRENLSILDDIVLHPVVSAKTTSSLLEWLIGFPELAQATAAQAIMAAKRLDGHNRHNTLCHALCFAGSQMAEFLYDYRKVKEHADEALRSAPKYGLTNWDGHANLVKGWALCKLQEDVEGGKHLLADYIGRILRGDGSPYHIAHYLSMYAEVHSDEGDDERAEAQLIAARAEGKKTGEKYWLAEVRRLQGEICIRRGKPKEAIAWFESAIELSRRQGAKSFEIRAATALARLKSEQGEGRQARTLLAEIYEQFSEGFDTPDLVRARELLEIVE
jgi:tetratricopeptide (TPR) repeat protein